MAKDDRERAIIIVKRPRRGADGHHGGAWKIAYADFVTAMMAFFLLLWLLASTTEEQRQGISDFFNAVPMSSNDGSFGVLRGTVLDRDGRRTSQTSSSQSFSIALAPPQGESEAASDPGAGPGEGMAARRLREVEAARFEEIERSLREAMRRMPELSSNLLVEKTGEGLRIQLVDQERSPMFASGSAVLAPRMEQLVRMVAAMVVAVPNAIAVSGHTDSHPLQRGAYTNWELSAERANAARRLLVDGGVPDARVIRVAGLADRQPLIATDPSAPTNRRISILLMSTTSAPEGNRPG